MSQSLYKDILTNAVAEYKTNYLTPLSKFKQVTAPPESTVERLAYVKDLDQKLKLLNSVQIPMLQFDPTVSVKEHYDTLTSEVEAKRVKLNQLRDDQIKAIEDKYAKDVADAHEYNEHLADPYKNKHKQLLAMKKDLKPIFTMYDITPLDLKIADNISENEFSTLIDQSIKACKKYISKTNQVYTKVINPLKGNKNLGFTAAYSLLLFIGTYVALPFMAPYFIYRFFSSTHNMYKDMEKLRVACTLMTELDYRRFVSDDKLRVVDAIDTTEVETQVQNALDSLEDYSEEAALALKDAKMDTEVQQILLSAQAEVKSEYNEVISNLTKIRDAVNKKNEEDISKMKLFPTVQNTSVVMSHYYVLGRIEGRIDDYTDLPLMNIIFDSKDRTVAINTIKLYLANILLSVRVKQLTIEIYDPKNMCSEFSEFFTPETKPYIKANDMTLDDLLKTYKQYSQDNILVLDNKDIDAYNREAEAKDMVPKSYKLLIIISGFDKLNKGEDEQMWAEYLKFSALSGVMIWLLDSKRYQNTIWIDGSYTGPGEPIKYTRDLGKQAVGTYVDSLNTFKDKGIMYKDKFADVYIPREKWWTWDTIKGIELNYGLENGDPTRGLPISLGDANVHALLGGATGSGKSATINQMLISLITKYPPSELQIIYIDFKNVEAAKFTRGYVTNEHRWMASEEEKEYLDKELYYTRISRIPHLRIISGTTDGEYALSVFEFLMDEMSRRQSIINKAGVTKIQDLRENILDNYNKEHNTPKGTWHDMRSDWDWYKANVYDKCGDLPRVLVIFDEFQQMFNPEYVEDRVIQQITGKINALTKLARAMACHLWFTSQDMKGTLSKSTISNFSLRGALRCGEEASMELLGNKAASTITAKQGYMYTNDSGGTDKDANRFWRIPFLDVEPMMQYIEDLNTMLEPNHEEHLMAELYDEKMRVPGFVVDEWYEKRPDIFKSPNSIILGERANFSLNKAPVGFKILNDTGENILIGGFDRNDMLNLTSTIINNVRNTGDNVQILVNSQDMDTYKLLDLDNVNPPKFRTLGLPSQDVSEFVDALNSMVDLRYEKGGTHTLLFVFCLQWERAPYISVDINYKVQDKFKDLLRKAPQVGVHFVFASREKLDMPRAIPAACKHRIAGQMPKDALFFMESSKVEKLPDPTSDAGGFALYEYGSSLIKFKIYQYTYTAEIESREIIIE